MHQWAHKRMQVELTQMQPNAVERMHADVERRILLARSHLDRLLGPFQTVFRFAQS